MAIIKLFAERERERLGLGAPDVLTYGVPIRLRNQLIHIWREAMGGPQTIVQGYGYHHSTTADMAWPEIENVLMKELGVLKLADGFNSEQRVLA